MGLSRAMQMLIGRVEENKAFKRWSPPIDPAPDRPSNRTLRQTGKGSNVSDPVDGQRLHVTSRP